MAVKEKKQQVLVRLKKSTHEKLKTVAEKNSRSAPNQIEYLVEQFIEKYETDNGKIIAINNYQNGDNNNFQTSVREYET